MCIGFATGQFWYCIKESSFDNQNQISLYLAASLWVQMLQIHSTHSKHPAKHPWPGGWVLKSLLKLKFARLWPSHGRLFWTYPPLLYMGGAYKPKLARDWPSPIFEDCFASFPCNEPSAASTLGNNESQLMEMLQQIRQSVPFKYFTGRQH